MCLNKYFSALYEACRLTKQTSRLYTKHIDRSSIEVLERFITIGRQLERQLRQLQEEDDYE